jgi:mRNA-degrading endonuclease toxin of MazEF toxin-antitoxin module
MATRSTTRYEPGDIVLLTFLFTGRSGKKQRPALVVLDSGDADLLVARITTQQDRSAFDLPLKDWRQAGLLAPSIVRFHKLATLEKSLVARPLGRLSEQDQGAFRSAFRKIYCQ